MLQVYLIRVHLDAHYSVLYFVLLLAFQNKVRKIQAKEIACESVHLHTIIYILTTLRNNTNHVASNAPLLHYTVHRKIELYARDLLYSLPPESYGSFIVLLISI